MRVAALVLCVLCLSVPFLALAEEGHGSHGSPLAQKLQSYLKKTAEARGSMKLEESPEHNALMTQLKEKTNSAIGRVFGKMKADTTTTTGAHRSLLQSDDFKFATSSDGCKKTLEDMGYTDIATQLDGKTSVGIAVDPKYTDCTDFMEMILFKDESHDAEGILKDFCSKTCKDDAVYWVGAFTSTCFVDALQFYVDSEFNKDYSSELSQMSDGDKFFAAGLMVGFFSMYSSAEKVGISTLVGCNTMNEGSKCASKSWWYDVAMGDAVDNKEENPSSGFECDATGKSGDYIVPCTQDWSDICDPSSGDTKDCCYTSGAVLANALQVVSDCPFQKVYQDVFQKFGIPWPDCSKDEIDFKCSNGGRTKYLNGMEGQATKCCEESSEPISAVCSGTSIADQVNKYYDGKTDITGGAAATKATLFIVVALVTVNWLGLL